MGSLQSTRRQSGFTLVELLIVAIILAILAAIIIPQFASTTTDAQESALRADVAALRSAIGLYRQQHGAYPGANASTGGTCTGAAGTGIALSEQAIEDQLTRYSNAAGETCTVPGTAPDTFPFGPYFQADALPTNPITGSNAVAIVSTGSLVMTPGTGLGWQYDTVAGKIIINDDTLDSTGVAYSTY